MSQRAHHPDCYQNTGVPDDMPAGICDCQVLQMLEMARKADAAERRAEEAEFHVEQLRDARDRAERQAEMAEAALAIFADYVADHPCDDPECEKLRSDLGLASVASNETECSGLCGEHHWLDRPESDTRECLICGTEASG